MYPTAAVKFFSLLSLLFFLIHTALGIDVRKDFRKGICPVIEAINNLDELHLFPDNPQKDSNKTEYPVFPDLVYEFKLAAIDKLSPMDFEFNEYVKKYITIYSVERREQVSQMLGLAELYFPLFEDLLDKYQLPLELKYLAVVESALNPLAVSKTGAVGLWQFKINSARMFNLTVNSYIDERRDPFKSTEAACQYLHYLYKIFNDWNLALAAYNTGPGAVRNAIERANGETNFWKIYNLLPEAAQNYVPAFNAAAYIMNHAKDHGISTIKPLIAHFETDTILVSKPLSLKALAEEVNTPIELLRFINPVFRYDFVPDLGRQIPLWLPVEKISIFLQNEEKIYATPVDTMTYHDVLSQAGSTDNKAKIMYKVKSGDYLHKIAIVYGCTIDDLLIWNPNVNGDLAVDQLITVWVDKKDLVRLQENNNDTLKVKK